VLAVTRALRQGGLRLPQVPLLVGEIGMVVSTVLFGAEGLLVATAAAVCVRILWRVTDSLGLSAPRDVAGGVCAAAWIPCLGRSATTSAAISRGCCSASTRWRRGSARRRAGRGSPAPCCWAPPGSPPSAPSRWTCPGGPAP